ncbi:hypothetical protein AVEN_60656-1 [Araneus ventricosus]|uniref:Reverse transcriptase domain-containing protein n=1 Tax=Araneus ventricosus TaxID=182803 RepID=A0A4Y2GZ23_ARAVE|nr:hypothetical protein AVEN_60656-1 [Araneus ventricosus]
MNRIGVSAYIRKAFLQISLYPKDKDYLRFLWYGTDGQLKYYRHCRMVLGVTSNPFLLVSVIQYLLESTLKELNGNPKYKVDIILQLKKSFYVDNCLGSVKNELEFQQFIQVVSDTLATRKLELLGWEYSDPTDNSSSTTNVLGMVWEQCSDYLCLNVTNITYDLPGILSKREILATTHEIFDSLGIACPVSLIPKLILQRLWNLKLSWDQEVDSNIKSEFCSDGESRCVRVKVQNGEVIRAVQNLYPLELSSTEELPSKLNQNCRCKNISPEQTPFDDAPVKSDGTIPADIQLFTITKSGRTVRIPRRLEL